MDQAPAARAARRRYVNSDGNETDTNPMDTDIPLREAWVLVLRTLLTPGQYKLWQNYTAVVDITYAPKPLGALHALANLLRPNGYRPPRCLQNKPYTAELENRFCHLAIFLELDRYDAVKHANLSLIGELIDLDDNNRPKQVGPDSTPYDELLAYYNWAVAAALHWHGNYTSSTPPDLLPTQHAHTELGIVNAPRNLKVILQDDPPHDITLMMYTLSGELRSIGGPNIHDVWAMITQYENIVNAAAHDHTQPAKAALIMEAISAKTSHMRSIATSVCREVRNHHRHTHTNFIINTMMQPEEAGGPAPDRFARARIDYGPIGTNPCPLMATFHPTEVDNRGFIADLDKLRGDDLLPATNVTAVKPGSTTPSKRKRI